MLTNINEKYFKKRPIKMKKKEEEGKRRVWNPGKEERVWLTY